ncbi:MAG: hypothetical protein U9Q75_01180, partial [Pseudomonadota bacterium]|nr:hypothetical protein [Pseudomonadota bacterium]
AFQGRVNTSLYALIKHPCFRPPWMAEVPKTQEHLFGGSPEKQIPDPASYMGLLRSYKAFFYNQLILRDLRVLRGKSLLRDRRLISALRIACGLPRCRLGTSNLKPNT